MRCDRIIAAISFPKRLDKPRPCPYDERMNINEITALIKTLNDADAMLDAIDAIIDDDLTPSDDPRLIAMLRPLIRTDSDADAIIDAIRARIIELDLPLDSIE